MDAVAQQVVSRREGGRDQRGQRRVAEEERDDQPGGAGRDAQQQIDAEHHADEGGHALAALEAGRTPATGGPGTRPGPPAPWCLPPCRRACRTTSPAAPARSPSSASSSSVTMAAALLPERSTLVAPGLLLPKVRGSFRPISAADDDGERRASRSGKPPQRRGRDRAVARRCPPAAILPARSAPAWHPAAARTPAGRCPPGSRAARR